MSQFSSSQSAPHGIGSLPGGVGRDRCWPEVPGGHGSPPTADISPVVTDTHRSALSCSMLNCTYLTLIEFGEGGNSSNDCKSCPSHSWPRMGRRGLRSVTPPILIYREYSILLVSL